MFDYTLFFFDTTSLPSNWLHVIGCSIFVCYGLQTPSAGTQYMHNTYYPRCRRKYQVRLPELLNRNGGLGRTITTEYECCNFYESEWFRGRPSCDEGVHIRCYTDILCANNVHVILRDLRRLMLGNLKGHWGATIHPTGVPSESRLLSILVALLTFILSTGDILIVKIWHCTVLLHHLIQTPDCNNDVEKIMDPMIMLAWWDM